MGRVVHQLVQQLLLTDDVTLQLKILDFLVELLTGPHSNPLMWRRIFGNRDIYETFFWYVVFGSQLRNTLQLNFYPRLETLTAKPSTGAAVSKTMQRNIEA